MSKHWNPKRDRFPRKRDRAPLPPRRRSWRRVRVGWGGLRLTLFAGVLIGLGLASADEWPGADRGGAGGDYATARIVDGDTFHYRGEKIRIADIDTPEVRGACAYETRLAARATARMEALLHQGPFELRRAGARDEDRYGRKLRIVTRDGASLGDMLVEEGLAREWRGRRQPWCR